MGRVGFKCNDLRIFAAAPFSKKIVIGTVEASPIYENSIFTVQGWKFKILPGISSAVETTYDMFLWKIL